MRHASAYLRTSSSVVTQAFLGIVVHFSQNKLGIIFLRILLAIRCASHQNNLLPLAESMAQETWPCTASEHRPLVAIGGMGRTRSSNWVKWSVNRLGAILSYDFESKQRVIYWKCGLDLHAKHREELSFVVIMFMSANGRTVMAWRKTWFGLFSINGLDYVYFTRTKNIIIVEIDHVGGLETISERE